MKKTLYIPIHNMYNVGRYICILKLPNINYNNFPSILSHKNFFFEGEGVIFDTFCGHQCPFSFCIVMIIFKENL